MDKKTEKPTPKGGVVAPPKQMEESTPTPDGPGRSYKIPRVSVKTVQARDCPLVEQVPVEEKMKHLILVSYGYINKFLLKNPEAWSVCTALMYNTATLEAFNAALNTLFEGSLQQGRHAVQFDTFSIIETGEVLKKINSLMKTVSSKPVEKFTEKLEDRLIKALTPEHCSKVLQGCTNYWEFIVSLPGRLQSHQDVEGTLWFTYVSKVLLSVAPTDQAVWLQESLNKIQSLKELPVRKVLVSILLALEPNQQVPSLIQYLLDVKDRADDQSTFGAYLDTMALTFVALYTK
jgi:hypothetical protein